MKKTKIMALVAALLFMMLLGSKFFGQKPVNSANTVQVVAATRNIGAHESIGTEDVAYVDVPVQSVHPNVIKDINSVLGKMVKSDIYKGEYLLEDHLIDTEGSPSSYGLAYVLEEGKRAMSFEVDISQGVSQLLTTGSHVDVIYTGSFDDSGKEATKTKTLLQDIKVVALGSSLSREIAPANGGSEDGIGSYTTVTLELTPSQVNELAYALINGNVWLSMRPAADHEVLEIPAASNKSM